MTRTTPREVGSLKASFKLDALQKSVLIGTLLGDGGLRYHGKDCRLHIKHSANQLSLVLYKRKVFSNITSMKVSVFKQIVGRRNYSFAEFVTLTHPEFTRYFTLFYSPFRKTVPSTIDTLLTNPLSLAIWFMDDGSAEYAGASLQTHSFTRKEVDSLIDVIGRNFGIDANKRLNKGRWIIYFPKASMSKLQGAIGPYVLEDFKYKFNSYSKRV